jgi:hypothetical protein
MYYVSVYLDIAKIVMVELLHNELGVLVRFHGNI